MSPATSRASVDLPQPDFADDARRIRPRRSQSRPRRPRAGARGVRRGDGNSLGQALGFSSGGHRGCRQRTRWPRRLARPPAGRRSAVGLAPLAAAAKRQAGRSDRRSGSAPGMAARVVEARCRRPASRAISAARIGMTRPCRSADAGAASDDVAGMHDRRCGRSSRAASARSWVISIVAMPVSRARSRTRSMTPPGSSRRARSSARRRPAGTGSQASAMAIITRWHMPPESSNG